MTGEGTDSLLPAVNPAGDVVLHSSFNVVVQKHQTALQAAYSLQ